MITTSTKTGKTPISYLKMHLDRINVQSFSGGKKSSNIKKNTGPSGSKKGHISGKKDKKVAA